MLKVIKDFAQGQRVYAAGDVLDLHPVVESHLIDSWPAFFERHTPGAIEIPADPAPEPVEAIEVADVEAPPVDKMIKRPKGRK